MLKSETIGNLALALSKAQGEFQGAAKGSENPFFNSRYADLYECLEAVKEPLAKNELCVIQTTDTDDKGIWVETTLAHSSGEWIQGRILMKPKKNDDQGTGSSITYGRRYGFAAIIGLAQKDDDGNGSCQGKEEEKKKEEKTPPPKQKKTIQEWIKEVENSDIQTHDDMMAWRTKNKNGILSSLNPADQITFRKYLDGLFVKCPNTDKFYLAASCDVKSCRTGCPVMPEKQEAA